MYDYFVHEIAFRLGYKSYLTLENAASFGGCLENIALWKKRGIVASTLTWNSDNSLGGGVNGIKGLTSYGKAAIREMEKSKMTVDVSHLNEKTFYDFLSVCHKPFIASHSNCFTVCSHKRNLRDWQLRELIVAGGIVGLNFYPLFLGGNVFEKLYENICHILQLGGENNIALGSDFDGAKMLPSLNKDSKVSDLYSFLIKKGMEKSILEKIFFKNAENFFNNVLQVQ